MIKKYLVNIINGNGITVILRILLGILFIFSGYFKAMDQVSFMKIIKLYNILPETLVPFAVIIMPYLELVLGMFLISGFKVRASSFISMILMVLFIIFILINIYRGETFDCGCFQFDKFNIGIEDKIGFKVVIRDVVIFLLFGIIYKAKRHSLSLDKFMDRFFYRNY